MITSLPIYVMERVLKERWVDIATPHGRKLSNRSDPKDVLTQLTDAFPDLKVTIEDVLQDGNKVVVRSEIAGTQRAPFMGLRAKNRKMAIQVIDIHEFSRGHIVRTWHTEDWLTGFQQLGILGRRSDLKSRARRKT
jgi:predicted ester cyclase